MNVYDFDGTIYAGDSTVDFFLFSIKKHPTLLRYIPEQMLGFIQYGCKKIKKTQLKESFFSFLKGITVSEMVDSFWDQNQHKIYAWYHEVEDQECIVISASPEFLLRPICDRLGIRNLIASWVDPGTGKFLGENCRGEEKRKRLIKEFGQIHIESFYSDSLSDNPLAELADHAYWVQKGSVMMWPLKRKETE